MAIKRWPSARWRYGPMVLGLLLIGPLLPMIAAEWSRNMGHIKLAQAVVPAGQSLYECLFAMESARCAGNTPDAWNFALAESGAVWLLPMNEPDTGGGILLPAGRDLTRVARAGLLWRQNRAAEAMTTLQAVPESAYFLLRLAEATEEPVPAIELYRLSVGVKPTVPGYYGLGRALVEVEEWDAALEALRQALSLSQAGRDDEYHALIFLYLGHVYRQGEAAETAARYYQHVLWLRPTWLEAIVGLAEMEIALGDVAGGIERLRVAVKASPESPVPLFHLATAYAGLGQMAEARRTAEALVQRHGDSAPSWRLLATLAFQQEDFQASLEAYRHYLTIVPDDEVVQAKVAELEATRLGRSEHDTP